MNLKKNIVQKKLQSLKLKHVIILNQWCYDGIVLHDLHPKQKKSG
jgi:hypothetical protein